MAEITNIHNKQWRTYKRGPAAETPLQTNYAALGHEVYHWPEFKALCDRLGIPHELRTVGLTVRVYTDEAVTVTHEYLVVDVTQATEVIR